jgi:hypothetical protein
MASSVARMIFGILRDHPEYELAEVRGELRRANVTASDGYIRECIRAWKTAPP